MKRSSPLRYPGGKSAMAGLLGSIRRLNGLGDRAIAEPFAGGAGASLTLLYLEEVQRIYINDADPAIYDFWWTVVNRPQPFLDILSKTRVTMTEWRRQRDVYRDPRPRFTAPPWLFNILPKPMQSLGDRYERRPYWWGHADRQVETFRQIQ